MSSDRVARRLARGAAFALWYAPVNGTGWLRVRVDSREKCERAEALARGMGKDGAYAILRAGQHPDRSKHDAQ